MTTTTTTSTTTVVATTAARRDWREGAACLGVDPELFFPVAKTGPAYDAQVATAKTVCSRCPVVAQCLTEALARIPYGIAGGLTEDERRDLARRSRSVAAGVVAARQRTGTAEEGGQAA